MRFDPKWAVYVFSTETRFVGQHTAFRLMPVHNWWYSRCRIQGNLEADYSKLELNILDDVTSNAMMLMGLSESSSKFKGIRGPQSERHFASRPTHAFP